MFSPEQKPQMESNTSSVCGVCGDASDGQHFGAIACRACAAFFRRSTVTERKYICRFEGDCNIGKDVRCMCRACRLRKCVELGMNAKSVQRNRDGLGSRSERKTAANGAVKSVEPLPSMPETSAGPAPAPTSVSDIRAPCTAQPCSPQDRPVALPTPVITHMPDELRPQVPPAVSDYLFGLPLIGQAIVGYRKLVSLRRTARTLHPGHHIQKLFEEKTEWREINFKGTTAMLRTDVSLAADMVNDHFPPFSVLETDHKQRLFRNFFAVFILIERAYLSSRFFPDKEDDRFAFSHSAYFEINNLAKYYECDTVKVEPSEAAKVFKPTYDVIRRCLKDPMAELKFTEAEMVGLLALSLWNDGTSSTMPFRKNFNNNYQI